MTGSDALMLTLYATKLSAHGQRVEMLLRALGLHYRYEMVSRDERRGEAFLKINSFGQIPVLRDGDLTITDSHAILVYLARRYDPNNRWLPQDPVGAALVQKWLSVAAGEIAFGLALARAIRMFGAKTDLQDAQQHGVSILAKMDRHLMERKWLASDGVAPTHESFATIADLACYGYVSTSSEAGLSLNDYKHVTRWLSQIEGESYFVPIPPAPPPVH